MKSIEEEFYQDAYPKINQLETELRSRVCEILRPLNEQSETACVEHVVSRIKTPESAINKLQRLGKEQTAESAVANLSDVVGIRLITHFIGDIYMIRNILVNSGEFEIVKEKDYIRNAKSTGYRSYHIVVAKNVDGQKIKAEIQLRTIAMDCWASLEHQIRYKKGLKNIDLIDFELKKCSDDLMSADIAMEQIWSMVKSEEEAINIGDGFFEDAINHISQSNCY